MEKVKYIFFDAGYTLVNEDKCWQERCREQSATAQAVCRGVTAQTLMKELQNASALLKPQWKWVMEKFGFTNTAKYKSEFEILYSDVRFVLEELSKQFRLGIIANQNGGFDARLRNWQIDKYFSVIVASCDYPFAKPDKRLFAAALQQGGCSACNAVMIGDRLDNDIFPAKELGFQTVHVKQGFGKLQVPPSEDFRPTYSVNSLTEILQLPFVIN